MCARADRASIFILQGWAIKSFRQFHVSERDLPTLLERFSCELARAVIELITIVVCQTHLALVKSTNDAGKKYFNWLKVE